MEFVHLSTEYDRRQSLFYDTKRSREIEKVE